MQWIGSLICLALCETMLLAQPPMSHDRLFAARLEGQNVVPRSDSPGSGTGIFVLSTGNERATIRYQLVYAGLSSPDVRSSVIRNFGAGKNGDVVYAICGPETEKCPSGQDGSVRGHWTTDESRYGLTPNVLAELANRRLYVEIETAAGREIRSQLAASPFMVVQQEGIAELRGSGESEGVTGLAVVRLVPLPNGPEVGVLLTVAGSREDPVSVGFAGPGERLHEIRLRPAPETKPSRTLRVVSPKQNARAWADPEFAQALTEGKVTLVVYLGKQEKLTVRGNVVPVR